MSIPGAIHCGGGKRKTRVTGFDWVVVKALLRPMAGSLRQESGLLAEALAKAGGGGGSRTLDRLLYIQCLWGFS